MPLPFNWMRRNFVTNGWLSNLALPLTWHQHTEIALGHWDSCLMRPWFHAPPTGTVEIFNAHEALVSKPERFRIPPNGQFAIPIAVVEDDEHHAVASLEDGTHNWFNATRLKVNQSLCSPIWNPFHFVIPSEAHLCTPHLPMWHWI